MKYNVNCFECDSEYTVEYEQGCIADDLKFCAICKNDDIELELLEDEEE